MKTQEKSTVKNDFDKIKLSIEKMNPIQWDGVFNMIMLFIEKRKEDLTQLHA